MGKGAKAKSEAKKIFKIFLACKGEEVEGVIFGDKNIINEKPGTVFVQEDNSAYKVKLIKDENENITKLILNNPGKDREFENYDYKKRILEFEDDKIVIELDDINNNYNNELTFRVKMDETGEIDNIQIKKCKVSIKDNVILQKDNIMQNFLKIPQIISEWYAKIKNRDYIK